jgi:hypothetical protein
VVVLLGRNDQYNSYSLNGAVFNNPFGLDAATPGQTGSQPISLDAIEQIVATPYDVTLSGFTELLLTQLQNQGQMNFTVRPMLFQKSRSNW